METMGVSQGYTIFPSINLSNDSETIYTGSPSGELFSPWHDISFYNKDDDSYNMVVEIPRGSVKKMEMFKSEEHNPIKQDTNGDGTFREYPYPICWNYGFIPQTWEDPEFANPVVEGLCGDNDPIDVVEIGSSLAKVGTLYKIKILGVYAMVDSGELDWKVIAINLGDPLAAKINSIEDVEEVMPGELVKIMEWFRDYKTVNGNPVNRFALNGVCMGATYARDVIRETHELWKKEYLKK